MSEADNLCRAAVPLHRAGRLEEAEALYQRALALAPAHVCARHLLGVLRHTQGRDAEALALLAAAVADDPGAVEAMANYAAVLKAAGRALPGLPRQCLAGADSQRGAGAPAALPRGGGAGAALRGISGIAERGAGGAVTPRVIVRNMTIKGSPTSESA